mgnify:CR=1 FL=1
MVYVRAISEVGLGNPVYPIQINTREIKTTEQQPEPSEDVHYNQNLGTVFFRLSVFQFLNFSLVSFSFFVVESLNVPIFQFLISQCSDF